MIIQMRYLIVLCFAFLIACNSGGSKKNGAEAKPVVAENVKTIAVELAIQGMTCTGCEQTIQSGISAVKGVKQVKANFKNGKAYVELIPDMADTALIREKVTSSGYVLTGITPISLDTLRSKL
jgi:copper chaperone CopZ